MTVICEQLKLMCTRQANRHNSSQRFSPSVHVCYGNSASVETVRGPCGTSTCASNQTCKFNLAGRMSELFQIVCSTGNQGAHTGASGADFRGGYSGYNAAFNQRTTSGTRTQGARANGHRLAVAQHYSRQSTTELLFQGMDTLCATYRPYDTGLPFCSARHLLPENCDSSAPVRACRGSVDFYKSSCTFDQRRLVYPRLSARYH